MSTEAITDSTTDLAWFKSSHSGAEGGDCIEVAAEPGTVHVRDSKDTAGPSLTLSPEGWSAFVQFAAGR